jgi:hypothetical protein
MSNLPDSSGSGNGSGYSCFAPPGLDGLPPDELARVLRVVSRPGPQPHNRIGTFREQLARARRGHQSAARARVRRWRRRVTEIVRDVLATDLPEALSVLLAHRNGRQPHDS